jgi:hypothetical protein
MLCPQSSSLKNRYQMCHLVGSRCHRRRQRQHAARAGACLSLAGLHPQGRCAAPRNAIRSRSPPDAPCRIHQDGALSRSQGDVSQDAARRRCCRRRSLPRSVGTSLQTVASVRLILTVQAPGKMRPSHDSSRPIDSPQYSVRNKIWHARISRRLTSNSL